MPTHKEKKIAEYRRRSTRLDRKYSRNYAKKPERYDKKKPYLSVLTWNVFLMTIPVNKKNGERAPLIAAKLRRCKHDIVLLQKVWTHEKLLAAELRSTYPFIYGPANKVPGPKLHSGMMIFSKVRLTDYQEHDFIAPALGAETMSRKGVMLLEGSFKGRHFQIANTHFQGHDKKHPGRVVPTQMAFARELRDFLAAIRRRGVPQIVAGDFFIDKSNTLSRGSKTPYLRLKELLGVRDGQITGSRQYTSDVVRDQDNPCANDIGRDFARTPTVKDYVFLRSGKPHRVVREGLRFRAHWGTDASPNYDLAYRYALSAKIYL